MTRKRFKAEDEFGRVYTFSIERLDTDDKAPWLLRHSSPSVTLNTYGHLFVPQDQAAAAIEDALGHLG